MNLSVCVWLCACESAGACRGWERASDPQELAFRAFVSCECWELNPSPLQKWYMFLIAERSLRSSSESVFNNSAGCRVTQLWQNLKDGT